MTAISNSGHNSEEFVDGLQIVQFAHKITRINVNRAVVGRVHLLSIKGCEGQLHVVRAPIDRVMVGLKPRGTADQTVQGATLHRDEMILLGAGVQAYHRTTGYAAWAWITIGAGVLQDWSSVILGRTLDLPFYDTILRPTHRSFARLRRVHAEAIALAMTRPQVFQHPEISRALKHEVIHALVTCVGGEETAKEPLVEAKIRHRRLSLLLRFEDAIAGQLSQPASVSSLASEFGVADRTLRDVCTRFLGMGPRTYIVAKRLKGAREALLNAEPAATVAEVAEAFGFQQTRRFSVLYRRMFGEDPSKTFVPDPNPPQNLAENT